MAGMSEWNKQVVDEFRANEGKVGGQFEGAPIVLMHHKGRKSGDEFISPVMYLPHESDPDIVYVFASAAGSPADPDWYLNMTASQQASVEVGTQTYDVDVTEISGDERDRIYAEQAAKYPGFAGYEEKTAGIRTIPVLALVRHSS